MEHALVFDTLAYSKRLMAGGFTQQQAETQAEVLAQIIDERLATKIDIAKLESRIAESKSETIKWVAGMLVAQSAIIAALVKLL